MDAKQIYEQMTAEGVKVPKVRNVGEFYADCLARIVEKLTEEELSAFIQLGVLVDQRSSRLIPVLNAAQVAEMFPLDGGRPIF